MKMDINYFVGKICTIYVSNTTRLFTEQQFVDYFVGTVEYIDHNWNVWIKHPTTGCMNFFAKEHIIGICEEQVIYPENEEHEKEILNALEPKETIEVSNSPYLDVEGLSKL